MLFRRKERLTGDTMVALTEEGKRQLEEWGDSSPRYEIMSVLGEHGQSAIRQINQATPRLNDKQVKAIVAHLKQGGLVRFTGEED